MTKYVIVLPFAYMPYLIDCEATMDKDLQNHHLYAINNTEDNLGVAESWNMGIDFMRERDADWLIVMSAAIRFGESGGLDMIQQLEAHPEAHVVHFGTKDIKEQHYVRGFGPSYDEGNLGWHLTAIRRDVIERVGYFDPNFYPSYFEDVDYDLRINQSYNIYNEETWSYDDPLEWLILPVDAHGTTMRHAVELAGVKTPVNDLIAYFATKHGVHPAALKQLGSYDNPFNEEDKSVKFFPPNRGRTWNGL